MAVHTRTACRDRDQHHVRVDTPSPARSQPSNQRRPNPCRRPSGSHPRSDPRRKQRRLPLPHAPSSGTYSARGQRSRRRTQRGRLAMPGSVAAAAAAAKSAATARTWARGPWPRREPGAALQRAARSMTLRTRMHPMGPPAMTPAPPTPGSGPTTQPHSRVLRTRVRLARSHPSPDLVVPTSLLPRFTEPRPAARATREGGRRTHRDPHARMRPSQPHPGSRRRRHGNTAAVCAWRRLLPLCAKLISAGAQRRTQEPGWGAPTATSPFWPHAPCSASTCGDQMLATAEFDFPLSGTHACGRLVWEPVQSRPGITHAG